MYIAVVCGTPPEGTNTVPVPAEVNLKFGERYVYSCKTGFKPASVNMDKVTNCTADGTFSLDTLPICTCEYKTGLPRFNYLSLIFFYLKSHKGVATRSENSNEIVSMTSYLRKTIVTTAFVNDFVQGGRVELYRLVALYCCILIG